MLENVFIDDMTELNFITFIEFARTHIALMQNVFDFLVASWTKLIELIKFLYSEYRQWALGGIHI